ncbi:hypothetical protein ACKGJO_06775 [Gracilimonas sp. Q87]|uniref:hypothetical protein n=1 Tax=Gracilimonas sp. Q87 TaxID=3384766 RepID=UPI0039840FC2
MSIALNIDDTECVKHWADPEIGSHVAVSEDTFLPDLVARILRKADGETIDYVVREAEIESWLLHSIVGRVDNQSLQRAIDERKSVRSDEKCTVVFGDIRYYLPEYYGVNHPHAEIHSIKSVVKCRNITNAREIEEEMKRFFDHSIILEHFDGVIEYKCETKMELS